MPRGDQTGPRGQGPMTGRGMGYCVGSPDPGYMNPAEKGMGLGRGFGRGGGRGWRHMYHATGQPGWARQGYGMPSMSREVPVYGKPSNEEMAAVQETKVLKQQADNLTKAVAEIRKQIQKLESDQDKS